MEKSEIVSVLVNGTRTMTLHVRFGEDDFNIVTKMSTALNIDRYKIKFDRLTWSATVDYSDALMSMHTVPECIEENSFDTL